MESGVDMKTGFTWKELTTQQLVRYEALFKLLDDIHSNEDISDIAGSVAKQWKYFGNVSNWRMVVFQEGGYLVVDGNRGEAKCRETSQLSAWDEYNYNLQRPHAVTDFQAWPGPSPPEHLCGKKIVELRFFPFLRGKRWLGLLTVAARHEPFHELDNKFNRIFGSFLAEKISTILFRRHVTLALVEKASRDVLTGLYNRGAILEHLESCMQLARREQKSLTVILVDIDFFKLINDRFGHLVGDRVLREVADRLKSQLRGSDRLGRYGGEEFLLILYPCSLDEAWAAAERFRRAVSAKPFAVAGNGQRQTKVTISLGTASNTAANDTQIDDLLRLADSALYASKDNGRNCVTLGGADSDSAP